MPVFVKNGPEIPEHLLQKHEEGRVIFFCGAGISYPAGLPDFKNLVDQIYTKLGTTKWPIEEQAYDKEQYDATLDQLERRFPGQRLAVRTALADVLQPRWRRKTALTTHQALLKLSTDRKNNTRLVTTNFDRIFEKILTKYKLRISNFSAPLLPIPKPSRWNGIVYLHGLLPVTPDETEFNRLILTSGDFGLAYLIERWAARFVSELFRNYTVCFVGYGINDPVLRYMMDALAADELLGETRPEAYAFGSYAKGERDDARFEWEAKGVTPLLYEMTTGKHAHSALHRSLKEWADTYRDGVRGKEMIIAHHANTPPLAPSRSDYAVGRVLWALTDDLAAKHFADLNPVPPLKWLEPLSEDQFTYRDLARFGVVANSNEDKQRRFSIVRRPTPYTLSSHMCLVDWGKRESGWDKVMHQLARWLTRHLNDPELILWLSKNGGQLHEQLAWLIKGRLKDLAQLQAKEKKEELDRIRTNAPNAIPSPSMRSLWRILLTKRLKVASHRSNLHDWFQSIKKDGVTPLLRMELREILAPCVTLRAPFRWDENAPQEPERTKDLVDWELTLSSDNVHSVLRDKNNIQEWQSALPDLLQDFTILLRDALGLMMELGGSSEKNDSSYIHHPSISDHSQNRNFHDWTALIILNRDAWLATKNIDTSRARLIAEDWWRVPFPLFKRLALFAASQEDVISLRRALNWLFEEGCWWLWSVETQRETSRLLVNLVPRLDSSEMAELEQAILNGPPRKMYKENIDQDEFARIVNKNIFLCLTKVQTSGVTMGSSANSKLNELTKQFPDWKPPEDERDEFPLWLGEIGEGGTFLRSPRPRHELVEWLKKYPRSDYWSKDDWRQRCSDDFPTTACALYSLAKEGVWLEERWREALQAWSEEKLIKRSWRYMGPTLNKVPDEILKSLDHSFSWWLQVQAKKFEGNRELFFNLCRRILEINYDDDGETDDLVGQAINHPVGIITEALLKWWYRTPQKDSEGLANKIKPVFTELCNTKIGKFRHSRVLLATHVIPMYRVDPDWAKMHLLPLFDWNLSSREARSAWEGFLWSPRLFRPFLSDIKAAFLETAVHHKELGEHAKRYAEFLTFAALDPSDTFTNKELADATNNLPLEILTNVASSLSRALEGAQDQRSEYWSNRLRPYFQNIWPKSQDLITPAISESFARLCIAAGDAFPEAFKFLKHWLNPVQHPNYLIYFMQEEEICAQFPANALSFLNIIIGEDVQRLPKELQKCLRIIELRDKKLLADDRFNRLAEIIKRCGID